MKSVFFAAAVLAVVSLPVAAEAGGISDRLFYAAEATTHANQQIDACRTGIQRACAGLREAMHQAIEAQMEVTEDDIRVAVAGDDAQNTYAVNLYKLALQDAGIARARWKAKARRLGLD